MVPHIPKRSTELRSPSMFARPGSSHCHGAGFRSNESGSNIIRWPLLFCKILMLWLWAPFCSHILYKLEFSGPQASLQMGWKPQYRPTKGGNFWQDSFSFLWIPAKSFSFILLPVRPDHRCLAFQSIGTLRACPCWSPRCSALWSGQQRSSAHACWPEAVRKHRSRPVSWKALSTSRQAPLPEVFSGASPWAAC